MPLVQIINNYPPIILLRPAIERITRLIANREKQRLNNITIIASDDATLNDLKIKYFNEDALTDTISFNYNEPGQPIEGEIYLSLERISENANLYRVSFTQELLTVIVHSLLHLFGYNDQNPRDKKQMFALQNFYLQCLPPQQLYRRRHKTPPTSNEQ